MDTKVALDMEIAVFRRLLESEEDRLGIQIGGYLKDFLFDVTLYNMYVHSKQLYFAEINENIINVIVPFVLDLI